MKKPSDEKKTPTCDIFKKFLFLWNDGLGFFSTGADHKLQRILGKKPGWMDKWFNCRNVIMNIIEMTILLIVVGSSISIYKT